MSLLSIPQCIRSAFSWALKFATEGSQVLLWKLILFSSLNNLIKTSGASRNIKYTLCWMRSQNHALSEN